MNIERQKAMAKYVAKNMKAKERQEAKKEKIYSNLYKILRKYGKAIDEITRNDVTEKEYKTIIEYFEVIQGFSSETMIVQIYPNLK